MAVGRPAEARLGAAGFQLDGKQWKGRARTGSPGPQSGEKEGEIGEKERELPPNPTTRPELRSPGKAAQTPQSCPLLLEPPSPDQSPQATTQPGHGATASSEAAGKQHFPENGSAFWLLALEED